MSAAEVITRAKATSHLAVPARAVPRSPGWTRRRLLVAAAAGLAVVVGMYGWLTSWPNGPDRAWQQSPLAAGVVLQPIAYEIDDDAPPAGDYLRALAANLVEAPYEHSEGQYTYHHTRTWGAWIVRLTEEHRVAYTVESHTWKGDDGSWLDRSTPVAVEFPDEASRDYWMALQHDNNDQFVNGPVDIADITVLEGDWLSSPPPSDHAGLVRYLNADVKPAVGRALEVIYTYHVVPLATRAAILTVLADLPGWSWRGEVTDRAGRDGVAVTFTDTERNEEQLLIFDPATGGLLAHERVKLDGSRVDYYTLILETDRRAEID